MIGPLGRGFDMQLMASPPRVAPEAAAGGAACVPVGRAGTPTGGAAARLVIVAGGVGIAPFPLLLDFLAQMSDRTVFSEVLVLLGFRNAQQARAAGPCVEAAARLAAAGLPCTCVVVTEGGSEGRTGMVTDVLRVELRPHDRIAVCGSDAMSRAVWDMCSRDAGQQAWFSLETGMACGVGSCHGCALTVADGSIVRVCKDGPVLSGDLVFGRAGTEPRAPMAAVQPSAATSGKGPA